eukprot:1405046-Amphidinium_carterae.1
MGCWGDRRCRISALPLGESICEDLALVGLARKPVMDGNYQDPSNWILDTVFRLGQAECGKISQDATWGWAPGDLLAVIRWPKDWAKSSPEDVGYNETRLFNVLETWFLVAIVLQRWDDLASVSRAIGHAAKPGEPAFQEPGEPPRPIPVEEICGPRKP